MANALRVAAINSIGTFVLFLGKIVVVIATGVISYYILKVSYDLTSLLSLLNVFPHSRTTKKSSTSGPRYLCQFCLPT